MICFRISGPKARKPEDFFSGLVGPGKMASGLRAFGLEPGPNTSLLAYHTQNVQILQKKKKKNRNKTGTSYELPPSLRIPL